RPEARLPERAVRVPRRDDRTGRRRLRGSTAGPALGPRDQSELLHPVRRHGPRGARPAAGFGFRLRVGPFLVGGRRVRTFRRLAAISVLGFALLVVTAGGASAHPLGNFTINTYD